jgi:hypothetical protein
MAGHGGEFSGVNKPGCSFPILPIPIPPKDHQRVKKALVETSDPTGTRDPDPTKSWWHGGDRDDNTRLASQIIAREELHKAIEEAWY